MRDFYNNDICGEIKEHLFAGLGMVSVVDYKRDMALIDERLKKLESAIIGAIQIESFKISPEKGEAGKQAEITVTWELSRTEKAAKLNGADVTGMRSYKLTVSEPTEIKLTVTDENGNTAERGGTFSFIYPVKWGTDSSPDASASLIENLQNKSVSENISRKLDEIDCGNEAYIYYCYPAKLGDARITQYNVEGGFDLQPTVMVGDETYKVYRSTYLLNGKVNEIQISSVS